MMKESENTKKTCLFFASDYHFEMISLPYISKNLKENKKVIVLTENNLEKSISKLLKMINLNDEEKYKINDINWNNNINEKIELIKKYNTKEENVIVFIKGSKRFIIDINNKLINENRIKYIHCYDVNEIKEESKKIVKNYDEILFTAGISKL